MEISAEAILFQLLAYSLIKPKTQSIYFGTASKLTSTLQTLLILKLMVLCLQLRNLEQQNLKLCLTS